MEIVELKMLRFSLGVTIMDKLRNDYIRETAQMLGALQQSAESQSEIKIANKNRLNDIWGGFL